MGGSSKEEAIDILMFSWGVFSSVGAAAWAVSFGVGWCPSGRTFRESNR